MSEKINGPIRIPIAKHIKKWSKSIEASRCPLFGIFCIVVLVLLRTMTARLCRRFGEELFGSDPECVKGGSWESVVRMQRWFPNCWRSRAVIGKNRPKGRFFPTDGTICSWGLRVAFLSNPDAVVAGCEPCCPHQNPN